MIVFCVVAELAKLWRFQHQLSKFDLVSLEVQLGIYMPVFVCTLAECTDLF